MARAGTGGKAATVVSVRSTAPLVGKKRKADDVNDKDGGGGKDKKATRRGGGKKVKR
jgi:N-acetyltransferase 10